MYRAALLSFIILFSLPAAASVPLSPSSSAQSLGGPNADILLLDAPSESDFVTPSLDVGVSVAIQRDAVAARLDRYALTERVQNASSDGARRDLLFAAVIDAKARAEALQAEEQAIRAAYVNGTLDSDAFVTEMARLDARARHLRLYLDLVDTYATQVPEFTLQRRLQVIEVTLVGLHGPVRDRALSSIQGTAPPTRLYVESSSNGVVLSVLAGDRYVREAYRADSRTEAADELSLDRIETRMEEIYPEITGRNYPYGVRGLPAWAYRITFDLPGGSLTAYIDGGTQDVFYEVLDRRVTALGNDQTVNATENGTHVVVNRSYPGGPLRIATYDNATGDPAAATVIVSDHRIATGTDGVVWTLTPRAERFTVTVVRPPGNVSLLVRPISTASINSTR